MAVPLAPAIRAAILRGATILTPNQRAARTLRRAFEAGQSAAGESLWTAPTIFAFDSWLGALWHTLILEGHRTQVLLNRSQEQALWRETLTADREHTGNGDTLADLSARAWHLLHLYQGPARLREFAAGTDARAFARWSRIFAQTLAQAGFITSGELPAALALACAEGALDLPNAGLLLIDCSTMPPAWDNLLSHIEQAGFTVARTGPTVLDPAPQLFTAVDDAGELHAAARWVRNQLTANPQTRIALVTTDQQHRHAEIERALQEALAVSPLTDEALAPQHLALNPSLPLYEFSLGSPLANTALADSAFALLRWTAEPLPLSTISRLLVSPFVGAARGPLAAESLAAARFDSDTLGSLKTLRPELSLSAATFLLSRELSRQPLLGDLHHRLDALRQLAETRGLTRTAKPRQPHAEWADTFHAALEAAGWTLAATRDSLTFQTHRRWESALDELAALDLLNRQPNATEALATLEQLAAQAIFAPESRDTPVQILGPLELGGAASFSDPFAKHSSPAYPSAGYPFDAVWFLAADDLSWPPLPVISPLLPFALQRALHMPGADSIRDQAAAETLTRTILTAAPVVVVSYAQRHDEGERRLSPLLARFISQPLTPTLEPAAVPLSFETIADNDPLPPTPDTVHRGGSSILQLQAACGFRAFAEKRLWSAPLETRKPGLDPRDRGEIVHRVMEHLWRIVQTQQALRELSLEARHAQLDQSIEAALEATRGLANSAWDEAYVALQRQRLRDLLRPWLHLELDRPEFTVRDAETELTAAIGPLRLKLRVDRIDETAGGTLVLDYKTGEAKPTQWLTDRPEAPQLPLYAALLAAADQPPAGIAFALLRPGETLALKGYASEAGVLEKPSRLPAVSFDDQLEDWLRILTQLATNFVFGDAAVLPRDYPRTCSFCAQRILCRLDPATLEDTGDDEEAGATLGDESG